MNDDMAERELAIQRLLELEGIEYTEDNNEHMRELLRCLHIYDGRSKSYGQAWKQYGAMTNLLSAARKVDRLMESWWHRGEGTLHKDGLDDAQDLINYAVFFMRMVRIGRITGSPPQRPDGATLTLHGDERVVAIRSGDGPWRVKAEEQEPQASCHRCDGSVETCGPFIGPDDCPNPEVWGRNP